jgi:hypothetical protein
VDAATDDDFLSPDPDPDPDPDLDPEPELDPEPDPESEDFELPESLVELEDLADSEPEDELSDEPFDPLAAPSLPAGTVLAPVRLSVR